MHPPPEIEVPMLPRSHPRSPALALTQTVVGLLLVGALTGCATAAPGDAPEPGGSASAPASETPDAEPSTEPSEAAADPVATLRSTLGAAVSSGDTDSLDVVFTDPVRVVIASSEADSQVSPVDAVLALDYIQPGVGTWEWDLSEEVIAGYRASEYYRELFPADVIVGRSSEGPVVAFSPSGEQIVAVLMAIDEQLLFF